MRYFYMVLVLFISGQTMAQEAWTRLVDIPEGGTFSGSFIFQNQAYVVRSIVGDTESDVYKFDSETELFTLDFSIPIGFNAPFVLNDLVYFAEVDNEDLSVNMWQYDPLTQELVQKSDVTDKFGILLGNSIITWVIDGKAYFCLPGNGVVKSMFEYDEANDLWIERAPYLGEAGGSRQSFSQDGRVYTVFGASSKGTISTAVWEYNPVNDVWSQKADYPMSYRGATAAFTIGDYTYVGTGDSEALPIGLKSFYRYHAEEDTWELIEDAGYATYGAFSFSLNGFGYFGAGRDFRIATDDNPDEFENLTQVWRLDPQFLSVASSDVTSISLFPNPATDFIEISGNVSIVTFELFDILGQSLPVTALTNQRIDVSQLNSGIYFLTIIDKEKSQVLKFIKK